MIVYVLWRFYSSELILFILRLHRAIHMTHNRYSCAEHNKLSHICYICIVYTHYTNKLCLCFSQIPYTKWSIQSNSIQIIFRLAFLYLQSPIISSTCIHVYQMKNLYLFLSLNHSSTSCMYFAADAAAAAATTVAIASCTFSSSL